MPFLPNENLTLAPPASYTAPLTSGPGFLSGLMGATPYGAAIGAASEVAKAALTTTPDNLTGSVTAGLSQQFAAAFNVGRGRLDSSPTLTSAPVDSGATAATSGALIGTDKNTLVLIGAAVVAFLILLFGLGRK